jgi:hypothetical protein
VETLRRSNRVQERLVKSLKVEIFCCLRKLLDQKLKNYEYRKEKRAVYSLAGNKKLHDECI